MAENEGYTDEQLAAAFPGQDVGQIRASLDKADGKDVDVSPNADDQLPSDAPAEGEVVYPDYIPEKFRQGTVDEAVQKMAASYVELEKTRSGKPDAATGGDDTADKETPPDDTADTAEGEASLTTASDEYLANNGEISAETYAKLAEKGLSKQLVDGYVAGQQAIADQTISKIHTAAGGEEAYTRMMEWAGTNLTDAEVAAYDAVMDSGTQESIELAVAGLQAKYSAAAGKNPKLLLGGSDSGNSEPTYQSRQEMTKDMRDPRYKTDPAFRKQVERKLANSTIW